ncbi:MAG TPA: Rid family hydrolase, partial [Vicinamibacteria bacterium]|nr:Rid family hydrolase [Vicinamibacteria bacterium]
MSNDDPGSDPSSEEYGRAHREFFSQHPPATSMVEVRSLIHPDMLIEIEVDA